MVYVNCWQKFWWSVLPVSYKWVIIYCVWSRALSIWYIFLFYLSVVYEHYFWQLHYAFLLVFQFLKHVRENYSALQIREIFLDILCYNTCNSLMKACLRCLNCSNEFVHSIVTKMSHLNNFVPCEIYNRKQFVSHHSLSHFSDQSSKKSMHYC